MKYHTFLPKFHDQILQRSKQTTIRGRTLVKPGEVFALRHWTGKAYRSPMGILGTATCQDVRSIVITEEGIMSAPLGGLTDYRPRDNEETAIRDGFASWSAMRDHFLDAHDLPFVGVLIIWGETFLADGEPW